MAAIPNAASVALIAQDKVLLVKRARPPLAGKWTLPGGRLEPGETAERCAVREIGEELGLLVRRLQPVMLLETGGFVLEVFATDAFEGDIAPSDEIVDHAWVRPEATGALETTPRLEEALARAMQLFNRR